MKEKRGLSGVYIRHLNKETGKWENRVFEELPSEEQREWMDQQTDKVLKNLVIILADALVAIGNKFDLTTEYEYEEE